MISFSIIPTKEEQKLADCYARLHGISLGEAFKRGMFAKIEKEFEVILGKHAYEEYIKDPEIMSHEALLEIFDLCKDAK